MGTSRPRITPTFFVSSGAHFKDKALREASRPSTDDVSLELRTEVSLEEKSLQGRKELSQSKPLSIKRVGPINTAKAICAPRETEFKGWSVSGSKNSI